MGKAEVEKLYRILEGEQGFLINAVILGLFEPSIVIHIYNPHPKKGEAGGSQVAGQFWLHRKTLSQQTKSWSCNIVVEHLGNTHGTRERSV
jgi:hypothetical protein